MICWAASAQGKQFATSENESLNDAFKRAGEQEAMLLAYPSAVLNSISCKAENFNYSSAEELVHQLTERYNLNFYKYDESKFLIRKSDSNDNSDVISGRLVDDDTGEPLFMASIYWSDFSEGVFSDVNGNFEIRQPVDNRVKIIISFLGYQTLELTAEQLLKMQSISMEIEAHELATPVIEYYIPSLEFRNNGSLLVSESGFRGPSSASGLFGRDLLRYIQLLAGVSAFNDDDVSIKVRGSNSEGTRIILDGMPLYNISHYYGIFSSINSSYVSDLRFYKNNQPIEHEGLSGGIVLLSSDKPEENTQELDVSLLTASAKIDIPITKELSLRTAGRRAYRNVNNTSLLDLNTRDQQNFSNQTGGNAFVESQPDFKFYDINASLVLDREHSKTSINFFRSFDKLENIYDLELNLSNQNLDRQIFANYEEWSSSAGSFIWQNDIGKNSGINFVSYFSKYNFSSLIDTEIRLPENMSTLTNQNKSELNDYGAKVFLTHRIGNHRLLYGTEYKRNEVENQLIAENGKKLIDYSENVGYTSLFASYILNSGDWRLSAGLRTPMYQNDKRHFKIHYSPQIGLNYNLNNNAYLKFSFNRTNQILREVEYENRLGQSLNFYQLASLKNTPVLKTDNLMLGYNWMGPKWGFDLEFYSKKMKGILMLSNEQPGFKPDGNARPPRVENYRVYSGERRVLGMDISLSYREGSYTGWLAYTLSKSDDRYPQVFKGEYFSGQDDRRHQLKWINEWRIGQWELNLNLVFASGRPYLALESFDGLSREMLDRKENLKRLPDYFRSDISATYNFNIMATRARLGVSVYNLSNRQNVKYLQYAYRVKTEFNGKTQDFILGTESELLNRSVNLNFSINF